MFPVTARRQRGLSIVELMVGVTIGLFIVAAAAMLVSGQLTSNRRLLLDAQLQQDLRAATEVVARELRRPGAMNDQLAINSTWQPDVLSQYINPFAAAGALANAGTNDTEATYRYVRSPNRLDFGYKILDGALWTMLDGSYQEFTDKTVMKITSFKVTTDNVAEVPLTCPNDCSTGGTACWPKIIVRNMTVEISAESAADPNVKRSSRATVRVRADLMKRADGSVPTATSGWCPA